MIMVISYIRPAGNARSAPRNGASGSKRIIPIGKLKPMKEDVVLSVFNVHTNFSKTNNIMRSLIILFIVASAGCAYGVSEEIAESPALVIVSHSAPLKDAGIESYDAWTDPDACIPERFAADAIPYGFKYDINCPPDIYDPPRWIPPWDPSPIIKSESK